MKEHTHLKIQDFGSTARKVIKKKIVWKIMLFQYYETIIMHGKSQRQGV